MNRLQQSRRQKIGYVYYPQVCNNVAKVPYQRNPYKIQQLSFDNKMGGEGFMDVVRGLYTKGKSFLSKAEQFATSETGTALRNLIPDSDETARPGFAGEKHAILKLKNGKNGVANYMGPGTELAKRLERGDPPRTEADRVAQAHDIRYGLAKTNDDIRRADNIMINKLKQIERNRGDDPRNIMLGKRLIQAKVLGEKLGVLKRDAFSGDLSKNNPTPKELQLMTSKLNELAPQGYGLRVPGGAMKPGDMLKIKLLKQMARKGKIKGVSKSKTLPGMKSYTLRGRGFKIKGNGKLQGFIVKKIVPSILSSLNIPRKTLPMSMITTVVSKALEMAKSGNLSTIISNLSKTLLPMITAANLKHVGVRGGALQGRGITDILGEQKNKLLGALGKSLFGAFKWFLNTTAKQEGNTMPFAGSGLGLPGGSFASFFKDFAKGFKMVFKPAAKLLAPIASALGVPEIGIPLGIVGDAL